MISDKRSGFTLIEMLVVIAVVGILSATVLTALSPARNKAKDTRVITGMQQLRATAEAQYNGTTGKYEKIDGANATPAINKQIANINSVGTQVTLQATDGGKSFRAHAKLPSSGTTAVHYCIDSAGFTGEVGANPPSGNLCQ